MLAFKTRPEPVAAEMHGARIVRTNAVDLRTQAFGDPRDPALLLIMGATASMRRWPERFCRELAAAGRFVIRFDNRDTGRSTSFPAGAPEYAIRDMADDAVGVLEAYGIDQAHIAGWSLGGMIAQHMAILHPRRVQSLFLFATTPDGSGIGNAASGAGEDSGALPLPSPEVFELMTVLAHVDWNDRDEAIEAWTHDDLALIGCGDMPIALDEIVSNVRLVVDEARDIRAHRMNHPIVVATSPRWRPALEFIRTRTLVMHGTDDKAFPIAHARALAREIPGAALREVEGMGHVLAPNGRYWRVFREALIAHTHG